MTIKVFVTSNHIATFPCPKCGNSYQKDVSKFIGHETQVRLKYKCKCQNSFSVLLERRRAIRKEVNFKGFLIEKKQKIPIKIGCEFTDYDHFGELGKYFLFHF